MNDIPYILFRIGQVLLALCSIYMMIFGAYNGYMNMLWFGVAVAMAVVITEILNNVTI